MPRELGLPKKPAPREPWGQGISFVQWRAAGYGNDFDVFCEWAASGDPLPGTANGKGVAQEHPPEVRA